MLSAELPLCRWAYAPVVLGPNSVLDLAEGASFQFVEIQARSLAEHRPWHESLDQVMRCMEISMAASQTYALQQHISPSRP